MQKREQYLSARINGNNLQPLAGASVTVTDNATGLPAVLYQDDELTIIPQPLITNDQGYFGYKASNGEYTETYSGVRFPTFTGQVVLLDPSDAALTLSAGVLASLGATDGATKIGYGSRKVADKLGEFVSVKDFGAVGDGVTDDTAAIQAAIVYAHSIGGARVQLPPGTLMISGTLKLYSGVSLVGAGLRVTEIKLSNGANVDMLQLNEVAHTVRGTCEVKGMVFNGNAENNTKGGIFINCNLASFINPLILFEDVELRNASPVSGSALYAALVIEGGDRNGRARNLQIYNCYNAVGLWHNGSDWVFDELFTGNNASGTVEAVGGQYYSVVFGVGRGNLISNSYFGGNLYNWIGYDQVWMRSARNNHFSNCIFDTSGRAALVFSTLTGFAAPSDNTFTGCQFTNNSVNTNNGYPSINFTATAGGNNVISGCSFYNSTWPNKPSYAVQDVSGAGSNLLIGCSFDSNFATGVDGRWSGSTTKIVGSAGFRRDDVSQLKFPAVQTASTDPNTLDDYKEGTFSPTVVASGGGTGTYANQTGRYTKIGDTVFFHIWLNMTAHDGSGTMTIGGLPFTSQNTSALYASVTVGYVAGLTLPANSIPSARIMNNSTAIELLSTSTAGGAVTSAALALDTAFIIHLSGFYKV